MAKNSCMMMGFPPRRARNSKTGKGPETQLDQSCSCWDETVEIRTWLGGSVSSTDSATSNNNKTNNAALSMNWFGKKKDGGGGSSSAPSGGGGGGGGGGDPALTIVRLREAVASQEKR